MALVQSHLVFRDGKFLALGPNDISESDHAKVLATCVLVDGETVIVPPWIGGRIVSVKPMHSSVFRFNMFLMANQDRPVYPDGLSGQHDLDREALRVYSESIEEECLRPETRAAALAMFADHEADTSQRSITPYGDQEGANLNELYAMIIGRYCAQLSPFGFIFYQTSDRFEEGVERLISLMSLLESGNASRRFILVLEDDPNHLDNLIAFAAWNRIKKSISGVISIKAAILPFEQRKAVDEQVTTYVHFTMCLAPKRIKQMASAISKIRYSTGMPRTLAVLALYRPHGMSAHRSYEHAKTPHKPNRVSVREFVSSGNVEEFTYYRATGVELAAASVFAQLTGIPDHTIWAYSDLSYRGLDGHLEFLSGKRGRFEEHSKEASMKMLDGTRPIPLYESDDPLINNFKRDSTYVDFAGIWYRYPVFNLDRTGPHQMLEARSMNDVLFVK